MQKSFQQQKPYKKRGDQLSSSDYSNRSGGELTNYTEIMISTNNKEVPFISIFKPDSTKEHSRIQGAIFLYKSIRQFQHGRLRFGLIKLINARQHQIRVMEKCKMLCRMGQRKVRALIAYAFLKMAQKRVKDKAVCLAAKKLNIFQTNFKVNNKKCAIYKLQINCYKVCIQELKDSNELFRQITNLESQLQLMNRSSYSKDFIQKTRSYQRYIGNFIQSVRKNDLQGVLKQQTKRFQQQRSKMNPKRREIFENELLIIIIANIIKGYETKIAQYTSKIEQMQGRIINLQNSEELNTLKQQLQTRNEQIQNVNHLVCETDKFYSQIKRALDMGKNPQSLNELSSFMVSYAKKLQSYKIQQSESIINKMVESEVLLCSVIHAACQQNISKQTHKTQIRFQVQKGQQAIFIRFFEALQRTLISAQIPSQIIRQIFHFKQQFQQISSKYEQEVHQRIESQSLIEEMTMMSSQLKQYNENVKAFQRKYHDLVSKSKEKDVMIQTLTNSIDDKDKEIESLQERLRQLPSIGVKASSREILDSGCKPRTRTLEIIKQLLNLKMSIQSQVMVHQKQVRQMKNEMFEYQTVINQMQADILQKDHRIDKQKEQSKKLKERISQLTKQQSRKSSPFLLSGPQNLQYELSKVRQENQIIKIQLRQSKQNNETLMKQINQIKRQFYKKQKALQQKIRQKEQSLARFQIGSNQSSNNVTPRFPLSQSSNNKQQQIFDRGQEIKLLTTKVKSLQALLSDITAQYHDLQSQFQQVNVFPLTPDLSVVKHNEKKLSQTIRQVDNYAIMDDKVLSQKLKELMASSESLAYSIDFAKQGLQQHLSQKRNQSQLEKDALLHLVFSILLDVQKISQDSQQAAKIWKQLCQIKVNDSSKDFVTTLQSYSKDMIANSIKK